MFLSLSWILFDFWVAKGQSQSNPPHYDNLQIQLIAELRWRVWGDCSPLGTRVVLWSLDQSMTSLWHEGFSLSHQHQYRNWDNPRKTMPMSSFFIGAITSRVGSSHFLSRISLPKWVHVSGEGVSKVNCCMINRGSEPSPFFHRTCLRIEFEVRPVVIKAQFFFNHFKRISSCQCPSHNGIWSSRKLSLVTVMSFFDFIFFVPASSHTPVRYWSTHFWYYS